MANGENGNGNGIQVKWLMGILAVVFAGIILGWVATLNGTVSADHTDIAVIKENIREIKESTKSIASDIKDMKDKK